MDTALLAKMKAANEARLKDIEDAIKDAVENEGDMEVRDASMAKAQVLARTADRPLPSPATRRQKSSQKRRRARSSTADST